MENVLENYLNNLQTLQEIEIINEGLASFMKQFKPEKFKSAISGVKSAIAKKDVSKLGKSIKGIKVPQVPIDNLAWAGKKIHADFDKNYKLAKKVLDNSIPETSSDMKKLAAVAISVKAIQSGDDVRVEIKKFIIDTRKMATKEKTKIKMPPELFWEAVLGWSLLILFVGLLAGVGVYGGAVVSAVLGVGSILGGLIAVGLILGVIRIIQIHTKEREKKRDVGGV